jgi:saposin
MKYSIAIVLALVAVSFLYGARADTTCEICEFVVDKIDGYLKNNQTADEILAALESDCKLLVNPSWVSDCKNLITTYGPQLINYIVTSETPELACKQIGLCNSSMIVEAMPPNGGSIECTACEFLVKQAELYLSQNKTDEDILNFLSNDCKILNDKSWIATCQGLVSTYGPQIIHMLVNKEDPTTVCTELKICTSANDMVDTPEAADCALCQFLVGRVEGYLASNMTETAIVDALLKDCAILRETNIVATCKNLVGTYGAEIITLLVNEENPDQVCLKLKVCTSADNVVVSNKLKIN